MKHHKRMAKHKHNLGLHPVTVTNTKNGHEHDFDSLHDAISYYGWNSNKILKLRNKNFRHYRIEAIDTTEEAID